MIRSATTKAFQTLLTKSFSTVHSPSKLNKWKAYAENFKGKPASYIVAFGLLHEITAVAPIGMFYYALYYYQPTLPFISTDMIEYGNGYISKARTFFGFEPLDPQSKVAVNLSMSVAIVKLMMPIRIGICLALTPWTARNVIQPIASLRQRFVK